MKMLVYLDNGHGGLIKNVPQTEERRSRVFPNNRQLFEGEFNRAIVNGVIQELTYMRIPYLNVCPELKDITLQTRIDRANRNFEKNSFFVSIHSNSGGGHGSEFFCYPNSSNGRKIATIFAEEYKKKYPNRRLRTDNDQVKYKERNFMVLRKTRMPAVLTESFFFDNDEEALNILLNRDERIKIIDFHVSAIVRSFVEVFDQELDFLT